MHVNTGAALLRGVGTSAARHWLVAVWVANSVLLGDRDFPERLRTTAAALLQRAFELFPRIREVPGLDRFRQ